MTLLKDRGYPAKSVSSTVDNITAEALETELAAKKPAEPAPEAPAPAAPAPVEPAKPKFPAGVFVRSAQDIQREKDEAAKAAAAARTATVISPAPFAAPKPAPLPAPTFKAPPPPPAMAPRFAPPIAPRPSPSPAPVPAPVMSAPRVAPAPAPIAKAPIAPPPMPSSARPPLPPPQAAKAAPFLPPTPSPAASSVTITEEGGVKIIHLKPPIIVRDFAVALGLKPFKLISELMEMSIFASMNQSIDEAVATKLAGEARLPARDQASRRNPGAGGHAGESQDFQGREGARGGHQEPRHASAGGRDHGSRRPRQDLAPRRHSQGQRRRGRSRRHHAAHRRVPGRT